MIDPMWTRLSYEDKAALFGMIVYAQATYILKRNGFDVSRLPYYDPYFEYAHEAITGILTLPKEVKLIYYNRDEDINLNQSALYLPDVDHYAYQEIFGVYNIVAEDEQKADKLHRLAQRLFTGCTTEKGRLNVSVTIDAYELPYILNSAAVYVSVVKRLI